jgi:uncharacterized damage-inducible protein DinB
MNMGLAYARTLLEYNYWANRRVLEASRQVPAEQYAAPAGLSHGSLRGTLAHILSAEIVWRLRCQEGLSPPALFTEQDFPTFEQLAARWSAEEQAMRTFLADLGDQDIQRPVSYHDTRGRPFATPLWQILAHVVNHGSQFRAEAGVGLAHLGHSPGDLDMIVFFRERSA